MEELPDIINGISKPDLFLKFKLQLQKDFETSNLNGDFAQTLPQDFDLIINVLITEIEKITKNSQAKLNALLYRIDVSEMQIKKAMSLNKNSDFTEVVAELIIKRELQKIIIKEHFKSK
jgi:hypothetical protein